ncbi:MAG TPA: tripartite tricarboxylate transporter substrate binding protein [Burkholderiales bacterium]|jgi:tripartite-type tricarboxylate transporter receptor subunit TctC|nr:tripartite tricarboxylate transporter substrate binding protein [Burkholderiales bacterium]
MPKTFKLLAGAALALATAAAFAQTYPSKSIRLISPFAPGGGTDITARAIAPKLSSAFGQQVIVDNRGGAGGMVGVEIASKAPPDGYTIVIGTIGNIAVNPSLYSKMPYDPQKDLVPIGQVANALNVLVVHPSLPAKTVKEFIAIAKQRPGQLNFGSSGPGATDHLAGEVFNVMAGVKMVHIPYKGGAPAMLDLVAGQVEIVFSTMATAIGAIQGNRIRAIAMTGNQRYERMPQIPTIAEGGLKGFEVNNWYGFFAPAGTPKEIVTRLHAETAKALAMADTKTRLLDAGIIATSSTPDVFNAYIQAETKKWAKVVKDANIKAD